VCCTPEGFDIQVKLGELHGQIRGLRFDLQETLDLVDRLRATCVVIQDKLTAAEREYAVVLEQAARR
jgi:uncharacterized protein YxjI